MNSVAAKAIVNPFKGPVSFKSGDENLFFGRRKEVRLLLSMIQNKSLTTLFGSSGTGKTSLIQAKLLPELGRLYYHPIYIRINFAQGDPLVYTRQRILEELHRWEPGLPGFAEGQTLIEYAASVSVFQGLIKPVLFFDQFEELFTLGYMNDRKVIEGFLLELADLVETRVPDDQSSSISLDNILKFKVVFSLRQDWIALLEDYKVQMPSLLQNRFRLRRFNVSQAIEAIVMTGRVDGRETISESTARLIIKEIGTPSLLWDDNDPDPELKNLAVDPFILSSYCYQLFDLVKENQQPWIDERLVRANRFTKLFRSYYDMAMKDQEDMARLIETKLLTDAGIRVVMPLEALLQETTITELQLRQICEVNGILRLSGPPGSVRVEITHDQLAKQIFERRKEREAKDEQKRLNVDAIEKNNKAAADQASAKRLRKYTLWLVIASIVAVLISFAGMFIYISNNTQAKNLHGEIRQKDSVIGGLEKDKELLLAVYPDSVRNLVRQLDLLSASYFNLSGSSAVTQRKLQALTRDSLTMADNIRRLERGVQVSNERMAGLVRDSLGNVIRIRDAAASANTCNQQLKTLVNENSQLKVDTGNTGRLLRNSQGEMRHVRDSLATIQKGRVVRPQNQQQQQQQQKH